MNGSVSRLARVRLSKNPLSIGMERKKMSCRRAEDLKVRRERRVRGMSGGAAWRTRMGVEVVLVNIPRCRSARVDKSACADAGACGSPAGMRAGTSTPLCPAAPRLGTGIRHAGHAIRVAPRDGRMRYMAPSQEGDPGDGVRWEGRQPMMRCFPRAGLNAGKSGRGNEESMTWHINA